MLCGRERGELHGLVGEETRHHVRGGRVEVHRVGIERLLVLHAAQLLVLVGEHQLSVASDHFRLILICVTSSQPLSPINTSRMAEASSKSPHSTLIYVSRSQQPHSHDRPSEVVGGRNRVGAAEDLAGGLILVHLLQELAVLR